VQPPVVVEVEVSPQPIHRFSHALVISDIHLWASSEEVDERKTLIYNTGEELNDA
jgi:hypothetical protein